VDLVILVLMPVELQKNLGFVLIIFDNLSAGLSEAVKYSPFGCGDLFSKSVLY